jgi:phytanoyl-CoA hydroxylase
MSLPSYKAPRGGQLTDEMVSAYREAGVLILEDFVSLEACAELRSRALQLVDAFDASAVQSVFSTTDQEQLDDRYFIESGDKIRFFFESDAFDESGQLRDSKENLLNKMGQMYIFKPPRIGGEVVCHQDSTYIYTEPNSCVGFWFALEDATTENGCMHFIPGQHNKPLKSRNRRSGKFNLKTEVLDDTPWPEHLKEAAPARAGSVVIFDGRAPHLSDPNLSEKSRHAYTLHTIDRACHYPAENWLQRGDELPLRGFE